MTGQDYSQYAGKKVVLKLNDTEEPLEGTVDSGNELGVLFKPKGKASLDLIDAGRIESIEAAPDAPKKLSVKALQPLKDTGARQHLVDRHAYKVADIEGLSDEDALKFHDSEVGHDGLGHNHTGKPKDSATEGEAAADAAPAEEPAA